MSSDMTALSDDRAQISNMKNFLKKFWWLIVIIIVIIGGIWMASNKKPTETYTTEKAKRGNLEQTVTATGSVKPGVDIQLMFMASGKLLANNVKVGDTVKAGQILASLDAQDLNFRRQQAAASLAQARATLDKIKAGATPEDLNVSEKSVASAQASFDKALDDLATAKQNLLDVTATYSQNVENSTNSALTVAESAIADAEVSLDDVKNIHEDSDAANYLAPGSPNIKQAELSSYTQARKDIATAKASLAAAKTDKSNAKVDAALSSSLTALNSSFTDLTNMFSVLSISSYSTYFTQTELETYKATIATDITSSTTNIKAFQSSQQSLLSGRLAKTAYINNAQSSVTAAENLVNSAKSNLDIAQSQYNLKNAPAQTYDLAVYQAQVAQAAATYNIANKAFSDSTLRAPINGVVSSVKYERGELVTPTVAAITLVNNDAYDIEVDISESDIEKIRVENKTNITLDAFGAEKLLTGKVLSIEPAETVIQDVIYYKVKIAIDDVKLINESLKPGMTANIIIHTAEKNNVIFIPRRAVIDKNGKKIVRLLVNGAPQEVEVTTGLKGDNGQIEITEGLNEGEEVITFTKKD